jgi:CRISPR-associated protein Cpf1
MRSKVIKNPYIHKAGSVLLNKRDKSGYPIPNNVYTSLFDYLNGKKSKSDLSEEELSYLDRINYKTGSYDIVKDRRYTSDKFIVNIPMTMNKGHRVTDKEFNAYVRREYNLSQDVHLMGIDRGERNMIYVTVVDHNGKTVEQKSLNILDGYDYQMKLTQLEKERRDNQKKWKPAGQIKHFKEGYVGKAVHEICRLMLKYNAIIVMESLNKKFMTRRSASFGSAVYSQFQKALLNKLSYLVLKDRNPLEEGGILNGYQFASSPDKIEEQPVQYGRVLFVTAGYTSSIDPVTGFVSLFSFNEYEDSNEKAKKFTNGFDIIRVNEENVAELFFSYDKFKTSEKWTNKTWHCIIKGERIIPHKNQNTGFWEYHNEDMREELDGLFEKYGKKLAAGTDIKALMGDIRKENPEIDKEFVFLMKKVFRLRNFNRETGEDYIISPAVDSYGETFDSRDSRNAEIGRPVNGDSNGSRNIALKGLMSLKSITETEKFHSVSNADWFRGVESFSE